MDKAILDAISAEAMEQYECIRQSGVTNMYDQMGVAVAADAEGFYDLVVIAVDRKLYSMLLSNFGELMRHYGITQKH